MPTILGSSFCVITRQSSQPHPDRIRHRRGDAADGQRPQARVPSRPDRPSALRRSDENEHQVAIDATTNGFRTFRTKRNQKNQTADEERREVCPPPCATPNEPRSAARIRTAASSALSGRDLPLPLRLFPPDGSPPVPRASPDNCLRPSQNRLQSGWRCRGSESRRGKGERRSHRRPARTSSRCRRYRRKPSRADSRAQVRRRTAC